MFQAKAYPNSCPVCSFAGDHAFATWAHMLAKARNDILHKEEVMKFKSTYLTHESNKSQ